MNSSGIRRASLAAAGLALGMTTALTAGLIISPAPASAATAPAVAPVNLKSTGVFIVGDSLTVGSSSSLRKQLRPHVRSVSVDARVGRHSGEGISKLRSAKAKAAGIWVVALGTNDGPSASQTRKNVASVMRLAGPTRQVIWVNVVRPGPYSRVNNELRRLDAGNDRLTVLDWAAIIKARRQLLSGDRVHLTSTGYRLRASVTTKAVLALGNPV